jgi:PAS domain S-box-containing protein
LSPVQAESGIAVDSPAGAIRGFVRSPVLRWSGPVLTVAIVLILTVAAAPDRDAALRLSGLSPLLVAAVIYAALVGGTIVGLTSAAIAVLFVAGSTSPPGAPFHYSSSDLERLIVLAVVLPSVALVLGFVRVRLDRHVVRERSLRAAAEAEGERGRRILESITDGFFALDREWRYTYVNREAERLVGRPRDQLLGHVVWTEFPALVGSDWEREYRRAFEQNTSVHFESYYPPLDKWFETHAYPSDEALAIYIRSIDERKRAEEQLRLRARQQAAVAALGERALAGLEIGALLDLAVKTVADTLGLEYAKVLELLPDGRELLLRAGVGWRDGFVGTHRMSAGARSQAGYTLLAREAVVVPDLGSETRFAGPDLLLAHGVVSGASVVIPGPDRPFGVLGAHTRTKRAFTEDDCNYLRSVANVLADAISRKSAEQEIQASEARLRQLAENIREVFYVIDWDPARVVYVSPAYEEIWGYPRASLHERPTAWLEAVYPEDRARVESALPTKNSGALDSEYRIVRPDGRVRWIHDRSFPVAGHEGVQRVVGVAEDVTERKAAEEGARRLAAAEARVAARDEVIAVVSHDLRSPLASVAMSAEVLSTPQPEERRQKYVGVIQRSAEQMTRLVDDLLDVATIEAGRLSVTRDHVQASRVVLETRDAFQVQAEKKSIQLVAEVIEDRATVWADRERLLQALANLVGNALKFTPEGGRVALRAAPAGDGFVCFSVSDTGPGISPDHAAHLFERFWQASTADRRGAGLGLAIVKGIVGAHGGRVSVASEPGAGSTFSFTIPTAPARAAAAP